MANENPSPEEELLKLVDTPSGQEASPEEASTEAPKKKSFLDSLTSLFPFGGASKKSSKSENKDPKVTAVNIKWWNNVLIALVLAAAVYLILDLVVLKFDESKFLAQVGTTDAVYPTLDESQVGVGQKLDYYMKPLEQRNPFISPSAEPTEEEQQEALEMLKPQSNRMAEILGGMKLVGISWSQKNNEPLAMIEDVETGRTYFARQGQIVRGTKIQSITQEKVVVTYEGEEGIVV